MKKLHYIILLALALVAASCGSRRGEVAGHGSEQLASASVERRFDSMVESYSSWQTINIPVKAELKSPLSVSLSGRAYMEKDKLVHLSMRLLGIEIAVLRITTDSVYCVDKVHKVMVAESIERLGASTGITVGQVQSMLLGRAFAPGNSNLSRKSKSVSLTGSDSADGDWILNVASSKGAKYECIFDVNAADNQVSSLSVNIPGRKPVSCSYSNRAETAIGSFPGIISCNVTVGSKALDGKLRYTTSSLQVDKGSAPEFKRPSGYRTIDASQLLKTLSSSL